jgi:hypothetical protein
VRTVHNVFRKFEELQEKGEKVGDYTLLEQQRLAAVQNIADDTSCGVDEEGQSPREGAKVDSKA